ncbi:MAG: polysaccharide deacetylase family protein [Rickettsiales bacterium]|nr:polysaccharide deacetylase family protein [Rickettsiales bacterium]
MVAHGAMFHHFHREGEPCAQGSITGEDFARALRYLGAHGRILSASDWLAKAENQTLEPQDRCITFDDNLRCQYDIAVPVMKEMGITAFFFIYSAVSEGNLENLEIYRVFRTDHFDRVDNFYAAFEQVAMREAKVQAAVAAFNPATYLQAFPFYSDADRRFRFIRDDVLGVEAYAKVMDAMIAAAGLSKERLAEGLWMDDAHLKALVRMGHVVGLHSYSHPTRMNALSLSEQAEEYRKNYDHIQRATGVAPVCMSHPCNSYTAETLSLLSGMGIRLGFCANMAEVSGRGPLEFPREDHATIMKEMRA